ncbi:sulfite exporter TauE/SafE family protein [Roseibium polysiphoniae]|uniref:sulfite exporter TauE/SafE family protein n=1 Tax=Roseibium polysiphoniae TaxID=2571221 RepID=UPI0032984CAD
MSDPVMLPGLTGWEWAFCGSVAFLAGCVRGFAGFGLSAVAMACLVLILPPVELIPIFYVLEGAASLAMFRGGIRDADMSHVWPLAIGSFVGVPMGLLATTTVSLDTSKLVAVLVILILTILQFFRSMPAALSSVPGRYAVGTTAGIVTGLASVGGMVIALYVLASRAPATQMRAALTMFLFIGMFTSLGHMLLYGVMTETAFTRGAILIPITLAGVFLGTGAFKPTWQVHYRRFCLVLLAGICLLSLGRLVAGA